MADSADTRWLSSNGSATDAAISSSAQASGSPGGLRARGSPAAAMGSTGAMMSPGAAISAGGGAHLGHGWGGRTSKVRSSDIGCKAVWAQAASTSDGPDDVECTQDESKFASMCPCCTGMPQV